MTLLRPLPGVPLDNLINGLRDAAREAGNVHGSAAGRGWGEVQAAYRRWAQDTETTLALQLSPADLEAILHTKRYWAIQTMLAGNEALLPLIFFEVDERKRELEATAKALQRIRDRWSHRPGTIMVPDTNLFLEYSQTFDYIDWRTAGGSRAETHVVIPLVVVDQLDQLKRTGRDQAKKRAQWTLRRLNQLLPHNPANRVRLREYEGEPWATVWLEVLVDDPEHMRLADADAEIVDRAQYLAAVSERPVKLLSQDLGLHLRARMVDLDAEWPAEPEGEGKE